jgi:hypothetical protein
VVKYCGMLGIETGDDELVTWVGKYLEEAHGVSVETSESDREWHVTLPGGEVYVLSTQAVGARIPITIWAVDKGLPTAQRIADALLANGLTAWDRASGFKFVEHK